MKSSINYITNKVPFSLRVLCTPASPWKKTWKGRRKSSGYCLLTSNSRLDEEVNSEVLHHHHARDNRFSLSWDSSADPGISSRNIKRRNPLNKNYKPEENGSIDHQKSRKHDLLTSSVVVEIGRRNPKDKNAYTSNIQSKNSPKNKCKSATSAKKRAQQKKRHRGNIVKLKEK